MFKKIFKERGEPHAVKHIALCLQYGLNDAESAMKYWEEYARLQPDDMSAFLSMGQALISLGRHSEALKCIKRTPRLEGANMLMGRAYDGMHEHNKAIERYRREAADHPDRDEAYGRMGVSYACMGDDARALECFEKEVEIKPSFSGYYNMGVSLTVSKRDAEAAGCYTSALEQLGSDYLGAMIRHDGASDSDRQGVLAPYSGSPPETEPHNTAMTSVANALARVGRYDEALAVADKAVDARPDGTFAKYLKASVLAHMGRMDECLDALNALAGDDPDFADTVKICVSFRMFDAILNNERFRRLARKSC